MGNSVLNICQFNIKCKTLKNPGSQWLWMNEKSIINTWIQLILAERQISKTTLLWDAPNVFTIEKRTLKYLPEGNETQNRSLSVPSDRILKATAMCSYFAWMLQDSIQWHHNDLRQQFILCDVYKSKHELITAAGIVKAESSHCLKFVLGFVLGFASNYYCFFVIIKAAACVPFRIKI